VVTVALAVGVVIRDTVVTKSGLVVSVWDVQVAICPLGNCSVLVLGIIIAGPRQYGHLGLGRDLWHPPHIL
ncbi:hypothetical protein, partial [Candidatus Sororendozoicomonas aggregata]|uniref:hypothetical protein n=1 Tax=Candidatus Sororendozoicomonas aggregata TaxID=3073239 RepID=UPI002ECFC99E